MQIFQNSVVIKYLQFQDTESLTKKWDEFKFYFQSPERQNNIRNSKEEQYQEGFLRDLFVKILGYTLNPAHNFNLTTELKNVKDSKKADGGIIINDKVVGIIELKGTKTTDLGKVEEQAFGYKNNQSGCNYVITSNFEKLRFYIDNAIEHIEFNLFTLSEEDFELLYLCLAYENIKNNIPKKLKEESLSQEELITKQLYKDYSLFKRELFQNLCELNPQFEPLELFKKSQKLLDRCLFLFFAEDRNLLPPNSVRLILKQWKQLQELDAYSPLYDRFKKYFGYLNTGFKGKQYDVFAYNGGLFKPDAVLDTIRIDDDLLYRHSYKLSEYDFVSEVDVNILGHIFENSLNELEEVKSDLEGVPLDKSNTKRKKDGVFYTPKYITKYIVENTIGKLCEEKKAELDITDEAYQPAKQRSRKRLDNLNIYRNWLLQLTICDPACGSGAFLNQALDFLINEHKYIDELSAKYNKDAFILSDVEKSILENNLFGVDLNEESVEIAKLSLWLRTAQPNRKLNDLNDNIKCGNSLINDVSVAGDKAFNWEKEFPQIFDKGGFDVVIGNPPYVRQELFTDLKDSLSLNFVVYQGQADLYVYFFEKGIEILKPNGLFSIIVANKWMKVSYAEELRRWMSKIRIIEIIDFGDLPVFEEASAYPCIITLSNSHSLDLINVTKVETLSFSSLQDYIIQNKFKLEQISLNSSSWKLIDRRKSQLLKKLNTCTNTIHSYTNGVIRRGIVTGLNDAFVINKEIKNKLISEHSSSKEIIKPFLAGRDVKKYLIEPQESYIIFTRRGIDIDMYPAIKSYLMNFRERLEPKPKDWKGTWIGRKSGKYKWYEIQDSIDYFMEFEKDKIIYPNICNKPTFTLDNEEYYVNQKCFIIPINDKALLAILNSSVMMFLYQMYLPKLRGDYFEPGYIHIKDFPIPNISETNKALITNNVDEILKLNAELQLVSQKFQRTLQREFGQLDKLSKKLENWHELSYANFLKELKKKKIELSLSQKAEWEDYFLAEQAKALALQNQINATDKEIDAMVYELYGLSEEEIEIVEES